MKYFGTTIRGFKKGFTYFDAVLFSLIYLSMIAMLFINLIAHLLNGGLTNGIWGCFFRLILLYLVICGLPLISKNEIIKDIQETIMA